ncbi:MAG: glycosyltransferase family 2 protein [Candidatus Omnitrophica bacterium]|nr:glycosyltransferase family 2 protein [Candidatus Omnitrophota bacterium]
MDISVIIVSCNSGALLKNCLDSISGQAGPGVEVIIVDNGSSDRSVEALKSAYGSVRFIENRQNLGAAQARNQAIARSEGEWVLTLDSDIILGNGFIEAFKELRPKLTPDTGMVQPNILTEDGGRVYSHGIYLTAIKRFYDYDKGMPADRNGKHLCKVTGPCSAAAFYKRDMLEEVKQETGYFDKRFFFLVEDIDLALRCRNAGWSSLYCPCAVCFHKGGSFHTDKRVRQYLSYRNRKLMIKKNVCPPAHSAYKILQVFYESFRFMYLFIFNRYARAGSLPEDILRPVP